MSVGLRSLRALKANNIQALLKFTVLYYFIFKLGLLATLKFTIILIVIDSSVRLLLDLAAIVKS